MQARSLLLWVRQGKLQAYALSGTKRQVWRFLKSDLDAALLSRPVVVSSSASLPVRSRARSEQLRASQCVVYSKESAG